MAGVEDFFLSKKNPKQVVSGVDSMQGPKVHV